MAFSADRRLPSDEVPPESDHMWPLDLALVALGGSLMYLAANRLGWDDPRWLCNAKTYAIAIPTGLVLIDLLLRNVASRFMQRSLQFGFLVSMFVHLLMLILAVNVVIFARYWPESVEGVQPERAPVRRSVPDNLFQANPNAVTETPDWSRPVDATSEARVTPLEAQRVRRLEEVAERLEMPVTPQEQHQPTPFLMPREQPSQAQPTPADTPSQLARKMTNVVPEMRSTESIETPDIQVRQEAQQTMRAANTEIARSRATGASAAASQQAPDFSVNVSRSQQAPRQVRNAEMPEISASSERASIVRRRSDTRTTPSLSAPAAPSVAVARQMDRASRSLAERSVDVARRSSTSSGISLAPSTAAAANASSATGISNLANVQAQRSTGPASQPAIASSMASGNRPLRGRSRGSSRLPNLAPGSATVAIPNAQGDQSGDGMDSGEQQTPDLVARNDGVGRSNSQNDVPAIAAFAPSPLAVDAAEGPAGLSQRLAKRAGIGNAEPTDQPMVAVQPSLQRFQRRKLGGMTPPPSTKVASVEPFQRRLMRTAGGAAPAPAGLVGPETEEAIERGLAFLASKQNDDGSWSLQGHGDDVLLQSDSAATALCILAFQGAGYTHLKHQYASNVAKALDFLKQNQRADGDLYRREDDLSNRACWLYSHSIAALCVCEAYGMTQDPELAEPAKRAVDFIVASQHPLRGGWRYRPQSSSDTSVTGWMMMALKSGELAGLNVPASTYDGIKKWLTLSQAEDGSSHLYRYNPYALDTPAQRHGRDVTPTMTAVGLLIRLYTGWRRDNPSMQAGAEYLLQNTPEIGSALRPKRDTYYWYYATQVMFHMGGEPWKQWNNKLHPLLIRSQIKAGAENGSWDPQKPIPDRWSPHAGRLYLTTLNLLSLEVYYRHLPIYEDTAR